ncbi:MAG: hypothetical protein RH982_14805 [Parvibaculum sp.]
MAKFARRLCAAAGSAFVCGTLFGPWAAPARAAYAGAPDGAIFSDHYAVLEEHEKVLNGAPVAAPARPPIAEFIVRPRRASLPPLPDIHEVDGITVDQLIARSNCPGCLPGPAAEATGLPAGVFEGAWRRAAEAGWRAGYDEMRAAADRAVPPGVESTPARRAYYLRYIRRIVHGWQGAVVHTLRAQKKITIREAVRYQAVLDRTLPRPGAAPYAPQRVRTGWVSDEEMDALDRRYAPPVQKTRLTDTDANRIAERFTPPAVEEKKSKAAGNSNIIPFARLATGYAYDFLAADVRAFLPADTQIWSRTGGNWTLDTASRRLVVSGGAAWPLGEATKIGTAVSWGRSWRDGRKPWTAETFFVSPFIAHALSEHVKLRAFGGAGYRSDHVAAETYSADYGGQSLYSGASVEGSWAFGRLQFVPVGQVSLSRLGVASGTAPGEDRARGRATYRNGFTYSMPGTRYISQLEPFANLTTHWTFDRADRQALYAKDTMKNELTGAFESGVRLKALGNLVNARLLTGIEEIGGEDRTDYTVMGEFKFSF